VIRTSYLTLTAVALLVATATAQPDPAKPDPAKPAAPAKPDPAMEKALELFKQQKLPEAIEQLKVAGKANPNLPPPKVTLAQWALQGQNGQAARMLVEQAIAEDPTHADPYLLNASFALGEGRVTDAILNLQVVERLAREPRWDAEQKKRLTREARTGMASCFLTRGDFAAAKEQFKGLLNDDPKNAPLRQKLAEAVFRAGQPAEALDELTRAFADDATLDPPDLRMAALWQQKANGEAVATDAATYRGRAEEHLKKAVAAHSKVAKCHREYAVWLMEDGRPDAAVLYLDALSKLEPSSRDTVAARALWHLYRKEYAVAEPLLEAIMKDAPGDSFATGYLCVCLAESGDERKKKRAIELVDTLVRQNPKAPLPYAIAGWCLLKSGRVDDAEKALATSASTGQVTFDTAFFLAKLLIEKQKFEDAHRLLKDATAAPHGPFLYRAEAKALLAEVAKKVPAKPDEPKKDK
jgi:tetratricopeptide (TPR) repeat protein